MVPSSNNRKNLHPTLTFRSRRLERVDGMTDFSRRTLVKSSLAGLALAGLTTGAATPAGAAPAAIPLVRNRLTLPTGIATGDVTTDSAVLWSRASGPGRLTATLNAIDDAGELLRGRYGFSRTIRGPLATEASDFTAKIQAKGLPAGTRFRLELNFEDENGAGEAVQGTFSTAPGNKEANDGGTQGGRRRQAGVVLPVVRVDRGHSRPGLGHQRADRRHARLQGHA